MEQLLSIVVFLSQDQILPHLCFLHDFLLSTQQVFLCVLIY